MDTPASGPVMATGPLILGADGARADQPKHLHHAGNPWLLALTALGVVYGDIGTSPLYAFQVALSALGHTATAADARGIVSLISWALILMVSLKYVVFVLRAD